MIRTNNVQDYQIREATFEGRDYIVIPAVMMKTGVHCGSRGAILHEIEELGRFVESWNGIPVTVDHPKEGNGYVSANSPDQLEKSVGKVFNTHQEDDKLKAEVWIDVQKLVAMSPQAHEHIMNKEPLDVSVGVFTDEIAAVGDWSGEHYDAVARNYRPDHLALLPGGQGACSWQDGCGIRANKKGGEMGENKDPTLTIEGLKRQHVESCLQDNTLSITDKVEALQRAIDKLDMQGEDSFMMHFLEDAFEDYIVYKRVTQRGNSFFRQTYSVKDDDSVELTGEPEQVRRDVDYVPINNNKKKEDKMSDNKSPCVMNKVERLIANERTAFTVDDREWLMELDESKLDKMEPKDVEVNTEGVVDEFKQSLQSIEDYIALMPEEMQQQVKGGLAMHTDKREQHIQHITNNTGDTWKREELEQMSTDHLEKLAGTITQKDYSAMGAHSKSDNDILVPMGVNIDNK